MTSPHSDDRIADDVAICICGSGMDPDTWREMRSETDRLDDENLIDAVIDLLWEEFDPYLQDGDVHPHVMRAIAARIVALLNDGSASE